VIAGLNMWDVLRDKGQKITGACEEVLVRRCSQGGACEEMLTRRCL
jgi:hypothetical protein